MPARSSKKRPVDTNQLARLLVDIATGETEDTNDAQPETPTKNAAAVALGKLGGAKGGKARAEKLSAKKRQEIAKKAAKARWGAKR